MLHYCQAAMHLETPFLTERHGTKAESQWQLPVQQAVSRQARTIPTFSNSSATTPPPPLPID